MITYRILDRKSENTHSYLPEIRELSRIVAERFKGRLHLRVRSTDTLSGYLHGSRSAVAVAIEDADIVGSCILVPNYDNLSDVSFGWIGGLVVHPRYERAYRAVTIVKSLFTLLEEEGKKKGVTKIGFDTEATNRFMRRLGEIMGYKEVERKVLTIPETHEDFDAIILYKELPRTKS